MPLCHESRLLAVKNCAKECAKSQPLGAQRFTLQEGRHSRGLGVMRSRMLHCPTQNQDMPLEHATSTQRGGNWSHNVEPHLSRGAEAMSPAGPPLFALSFNMSGLIPWGALGLGLGEEWLSSKQKRSGGTNRLQSILEHATSINALSNNSCLMLLGPPGQLWKP